LSTLKPTARSLSLRLLLLLLLLAPKLTTPLSMSASPRGAFIVLEGLDRCGKTTQVSSLASYLSNGKPNGKQAEVKAMNFPDRSTMIGGMINGYLKSDCEMSDNCIHLLFSTNRWEAATGIVEALKAGTHVICDRYAYSGVAFTAAKNNATAPYEWCKSPDVGLPRPDAVLFLTVSEQVQEARGSYGDERYETTAMQRQVRKLFDRLQADDEGSVPWVVVNADETIENVTRAIESAVDQVLDDVSKNGPPIKKLWTEGEY
jgi:dTMP kinase